MADFKRGKQSFLLDPPPVIHTWASVAGKKESEGPLSKTFDLINTDAYFGEQSWEQGEKRMQELALETIKLKC